MNLKEQDSLAISILEDNIKHGWYIYDNVKTKQLHPKTSLYAPMMPSCVEIINLRHAAARRAIYTAILEYELACAKEGTTWYRFVFANCLSQIIAKKSYESPIIYSTDEKAQRINVSREDFTDYSAASIWHLLCELNFNERIVSITDASTSDVITFFIEKSTENLKLIYYSKDVDKCKTIIVPASFNTHSKDEKTIFEAVLDSL